MAHSIFHNGVLTQFETIEEHDAFVASLSPTPDLTDIRKNIEHEILGKNVVRALYVALRQEGLSQANEGDLLNRVFPVLCALGDGFVRGARVMANNLAVAGQLTTARKNFLLARIDEAILLL